MVLDIEMHEAVGLQLSSTVFDFVCIERVPSRSRGKVPPFTVIIGTLSNLQKSVLQCFDLERRICSIIALQWDSLSSLSKVFCHSGLGTRTILANCLGNDMGKACLCVHMKLVEVL